MTGTARALRYDELVQEGLSLIPAHAPAWTNHNAADPGITLIELFAYFAEILGYRALRITPDAKLNFLHLLDGDPSLGAALRGVPTAQLDAAIRSRVRALAQVRCAVTPQDFERLAIEAARGHPDGQGMLSAAAFAGVDLRHAGGMPDAAAVEYAARHGDISVIVATEPALPPEANAALCGHVQQALSRRCLLTSQVHVVGPVDLQIEVACRLGLDAGVSLAQAARRIDAALQLRFGPGAPPPGGLQSPGDGSIAGRQDDAAHDPAQDDDPDAPAHGPTPERPFGRPLHLSEVIEVIDGVRGVDWVDEVAVRRIGHDPMSAEDSTVGLRVGSVATIARDTRLGGRASIALRRLQSDAGGEPQTVLLQPWERPRVRLAPDGLDDAACGAGAHAGAGGAGGAGRGRVAP